MEPDHIRDATEMVDPDELTIAYLNGIDAGKKRKPWVGLTDEDIYKMTILMGFNPEWKPEVEMVYTVVRNLEAKLKEKNT